MNDIIQKKVKRIGVKWGVFSFCVGLITVFCIGVFVIDFNTTRLFFIRLNVLIGLSFSIFYSLFWFNRDL